MIHLQNFAKIFFFAFVSLSALNASAFIGTETGNGGDICEDQFKIVRDDIASWIQRGGAKGLKLPAGVGLADYSAKMTANMQSAVVSCTSGKIYVAGAEKTCKNTDGFGKSKIICNAERFNQTGEADRYVLVHHEYAGLSGFEVNSNANSDYTMSNQISEYLEQSQSLKLAIKETAPIGAGKPQKCRPTHQELQQGIMAFDQFLVAKISPELAAKGIHIAQIIPGTTAPIEDGDQDYLIDLPTLVTRDGTRLLVRGYPIRLTSVPKRTDTEGNIFTCGFEGSDTALSGVQNTASQVWVVDLNRNSIIADVKDLTVHYPPRN